MTAASPLEITATDDGFTLAGEIDAHTAPALADAIDSAAPRDLVIDLGAVGFIDSSGLRVLIEAHRSAVAADRRVRLARPSAAVSRLLEISGTDGYLDIVE